MELRATMRLFCLKLFKGGSSIVASLHLMLMHNRIKKGNDDNLSFFSKMFHVYVKCN